MKRLIVALVLVCLAIPASGGWATRGIISAESLGYAKHTPNTETTLASTPDAGVVLPAGTKTIQFRVLNYPINVFFGSTATTNSLGLQLDPGLYEIVNDAELIADMRFIDTASGASTVTVEFYGER